MVYALDVFLAQQSLYLPGKMRNDDKIGKSSTIAARRPCNPA